MKRKHREHVQPELRFFYKNHRGEVVLRTVKPTRIWFGTVEWYKGEHWFLRAYDVTKKSYRDFALDRMSFRASESKAVDACAVEPVAVSDADADTRTPTVGANELIDITALLTNPR